MIRLAPADPSLADTETVIRRFPFRIGRSPDNDLSLERPGVWDHHASVELEHRRRPILAAFGQGSVLVNGDPVSRHPLKSGDLVEIGSVRWRVSLTAAKQKSAALPHLAFWLALAALFAAQVFAVHRLTDQ